MDLSGRGPVLQSSGNKMDATDSALGVSASLCLFIVGIMLTAILVGGCSHIDEGTLSQEANQFFNQGNYGAALGKYEQLIANYPDVEDRVLFEMGITYAYPQNAQKDYQKSLECFEKLLRDYPDSKYKHDSQMMLLQNNYSASRWGQFWIR